MTINTATFGGSGNIAVEGFFTWNGVLRGVGGQGSLRANGGTTIPSAAYPRLQGGFHYLNPLGVTATVGSTYYHIGLSDGSVFENAGLLDWQTDIGMLSNDALSEFLNTGTLRKTGGSTAPDLFYGSPFYDVRTTNIGTIDVRVGTLGLGYTGSLTTNSGTIIGAPGTTLWLLNGVGSTGTIDADYVRFHVGTSAVSGAFSANRTQVLSGSIVMSGPVAGLGELIVSGGGTLDLTNATLAPAAQTLTSLNLSGTLITDDVLTVAGAFTWNGVLRGVGGQGSLRANGGTTIPSAAYPRLQGGFHYLNPLGVTATVGSTYYHIGLSDGSVFENAGLLDWQTDIGMLSNDALSEFLNTGTLRKTGGSTAPDLFYGSPFYDVRTTNIGTIDVRVGTLGLGYTGSLTTNSGTIIGAPGTTLWLLNGVGSTGTIDADYVRFHVGTSAVSGAFSANRTQVLSGSIVMSGPVAGLGELIVSGGGTLDLTNATLAPAAQTLTSLNLSGTLITDDVLTVAGAFTWNGVLRGVGGQGSLRANGGTTIPSAAYPRLQGGFHYLNPLGVTATVGSTYYHIGLSDGSVFENAGLLDWQTDIGMLSNDALSEFLNTGTLRKTGGSTAPDLFYGSPFYDVRTTNIGTIDVRVGTLGLGYTGSLTTNSGTIIGAPGTTLWLLNGVGSTGTIDADYVRFHVGTSAVSGAFSANRTQVLSGSIVMSGPVAGLGELIVSGGGTLDLTNATLAPAAQTLTSLNLSGTLITDDVLTVAGAFTWNGVLRGVGGQGSLRANGGTTIPSAAYPRLQGGFHYLNPLGVTATVGSTYYHIGLSDGSVFENAGLLDWQTDIGMLSNDALSEFLNTGTLRKTGGSTAPDLFYGSPFYDVRTTNIGTIDVRVGTLGLGYTGSLTTNSGTIIGAPGTTLWLLNGVGSTGTIDADYVRFHVGTSAVSGAFSANRTQVLSGSIVMSGPVAGLGELIVSGGGTLDLTNATLAPAAQTLTSLNLSGTLITDDVLTVAGAFTWNGVLRGVGGQGSLRANGGTTIPSAAYPRLQGGFHYLNPLGVTATVGSTYYHIGLSDGSVFENAGLLDWQTDIGMLSNDALSEFLNTGTLRKTGGSTAPDLFYGSPFYDVRTTNIGTIDVRVGTLGLGYTGSLTTNSGTIIGAPGTTLWLLNGVGSTGTIDADYVRFHVGTSAVSGAFSANRTQVLSGSIVMSGPVAGLGELIVSGGGTLDLTNATLAPAAQTLTSLNLSGTLITDDVLTVAGAFTWNGGTLKGAGGVGSLTVLSDMTMNGNYFVRDFNLINAGDAVWTGGTVQFFGNSTFTNTADATFEIQTDSTFGSFDSRCIRFNNIGLLRKTAGNGVTHLNALLYNSGTVLIEHGQIQLSCGYVQSGPGDPPDDIIYPPHQDDGEREIGDDEVVVVSSYKQLVTGVLIEQISGHTPPGTYGIPGIDYGQLIVYGDVELAGSFQIELIGGFVPAAGAQFMVINNRGANAIEGMFLGLDEGDIVEVGIYGFAISYVGVGNIDGIGNDVVLTAIHVSVPVDLRGQVFDDRENDGEFNGTDSGIAGVSINLVNGDNATVASTTTGQDGRYNLTGTFPPGSYRIVASQPDGYFDGKETTGTLGGTVDNSQDSNVILVNIGAGIADGYDFAELRPSRIQGMVWLDLNNDGTVDSGERPIAGVTVSLSGIDDRGHTVSRATSTNAQGHYDFPALRPGNYTIAETQAAGYVDGKDTLGDVNGSVTGNATVNDRFSDVILAVAGSEAANYNFGERNEVEVELISVAARPSDTEPGASGLINVQSVVANPTTSMYLGNLGTSVSADGRYVAFVSAARLATNDTNDFQDVYVRDVQTGITTLVSVGIGGASADGISGTPVINADGRYVAFVSSATNLTANDKNKSADVFVWDRDRLVDKLFAISIDQAGVTGNGAASSAPRISADGKIVAFSSNATNLTGPDSNGVSDVFVWDLHNPAAQRLIRLSDTSGGSAPFMSADGQRIVFTSGGLVLYDRTKTSNQRSIVGNGQYPVRPDAGSAISADGKHIAYVKVIPFNPSFSSTYYQVYVYHVESGVDELISKKHVSQPFLGSTMGSGSSYRPVISADGSRVAFESDATNLTSTVIQLYKNNVYVWDRNTQTIQVVSATNDSKATLFANNYSFDPRISGDGNYVAFVSRSTNITADATGQPAVMLRDLRPGGLTTRISASLTSPGYSANDYSFSPIMSYARDPADPGVSHIAVAFVSYTGDLSTDGDFNGVQDVFLRDLTTQPLSNNLISRRDPTLASSVTGVGFSSADPGSVSADGRYVVFISDAPNLTLDNANRRRHVLVRDLQTNTTTLVDVGINGAIGNNQSTEAVISANGRFVAFVSIATNLVPNERNNAPGGPYWNKTWDVYVRDLWNGTTTLVSSSGADSAGIMTGNSSSRNPAIGVDANGWHVAFVSSATNLDPNHSDGNGAEDVYVRHQNSSRPELVSLSTSNTSGNGNSALFDGDRDQLRTDISVDGRYVVFVSKASNLVANDTNTFEDVFVRDLQAGTTTLVSVGTTGFSGNSASSRPAIAVDADGHWRVAFVSFASNLTVDTSTLSGSVFVRDQRGTTTLVSVSSNYGSYSRPVISADGLHVAFASSAKIFTGNLDTNGTSDVFVRDMRPGGTTRLVSVGTRGAAGNALSFRPVISADGQYVAFASYASNLTANDTNGTVADVFVRDLLAASTTLFSATPDGSGGNGHSQVPVFISVDGQSVVFNSSANNLVGRDYNGTTDVFAARSVGPAGPTETGGSVSVEMRADPTDSSLTALFIIGSDGNDDIVVSAGTGNGALAVAVNGTTVGETYQPTGHVYVYGRNGYDHLTVRATAPLGAVIDGEEGVDTVTIFLGSLLGQVTVNDSGTADLDSLTVNGTPEDDFIHKTEGLVTFGIPASETIVYSNIRIGHIIVDGGAGNDTIVDPGSGTLILGGLGNDTLFVDATSGSGVWLDGGDGSDTYIVELGSLFGSVTIADGGNDGTDRVTVLGTDGNDRIDVAGNSVTSDLQTVLILTPMATLTVDARGGDDQVLSRTLSASDLELILDGGAGNDFFLNSGSTSKLIGGPGDDTFLITGTFGTGVRVEDHDGSNEVIVYLGTLAGPVTVDVSGVLGTTSLTVIGTGGADEIVGSQAGITTGTGEVIALIGFVQQLSIDLGTDGGRLILDNLGSSPTRYNIVAATNGANVNLQVIGMPPDLTVNDNHAPKADAGGPYTINEGGSLVLNASLSTDSDEVDGTLTYEWDFDSDGQYDDAVGANPIFSAVGMDGFTGASVTVRLRVTDSVGATSIDATTIAINNANPGPMIDPISSDWFEGMAITVVGSATDPAGTNDTLTYSWAVYKNGSATAFTTGANSTSFSFTPNDNGNYRLVLTVTDDDGGVGTDTATVTVNNVAPQTSLTGPSTGQQGIEVSLSATGEYDPSPADTSAGFTYLWNVTHAGNPVDLTGIATNATVLNFVPTLPGTHTVSLTVTDKDGGATTVTHTIVINAAPGMTLLTSGRLVIVGTGGDDDIKVNPDGGAAEIKVNLNGTEQTFVGVTKIVIYANDGDDRVQIAGGVTVPVTAFGGAGADRLKAGGGKSVLVGGNGNDSLLGGSGRDVLIGGSGADLIGGNGADDILIAGLTAFDANFAALDLIAAEWGSSRSYADRVANLAGTAATGANGTVVLTTEGPAQTVFDDGAVDSLAGDGGSDWFIFNSIGGIYVDNVADMSAFEGMFDVDL